MQSIRCQERYHLHFLIRQALYFYISAVFEIIGSSIPVIHTLAFSQFRYLFGQFVAKDNTVKPAHLLYRPFSFSSAHPNRYPNQFFRNSFSVAAVSLFVFTEKGDAFYMSFRRLARCTVVYILKKSSDTTACRERFSVEENCANAVCLLEKMLQDREYLLHSGT